MLRAERMLEFTSDGSVRISAANARRLRPRLRRRALGALARDLGFRRTLLVADPGISRRRPRRDGARALEAAGIERLPFRRLRRQSRQRDGRGRRAPSPRRSASTRSSASAAAARSTAPRGSTSCCQRRHHGRLPRLRQGADAAAADDRHPDHRRDRQRGAELRGHRRRGDAHEDGVRRSVRGGPRRDPRSRADADRAAPRHRDGRLRRHRARGRDRR